MNSNSDRHPRDLVSAYLDGETGRSETALVETHLAGCPSCRALLEDCRAIAAATASEATPPVPAGLRLRIRGALGATAGADMRPRRFRLLSYRFGLSAAAGVVLVVGLWIFSRENAPEDGVAPPMEAPSVSGSAQPAPVAKVEGDLRTPNVQKEGAGEYADRLRTWGDSRGAGRSEGLRGRPVPSNRQDVVALDQASPGRAGTGIGARGRVSESPPPAPAAAGARPASEGDAPTLKEMPPGRILLFEFPEYQVSLSEDGTLALSSGEYACTVRPGQPSPDPGVTSLFTLASRAEPYVSGSASAGTARSAAIARAITLKDGRGAALRVIGPGNPEGIAASTALEMEERLRVLLRDRYIDILESRCGPAPQVVRPR